jgi:MFS family permease
MMAAAIPRALFMLFGGVLSDRMSPRLVMLASNASRFLLVGLMAFLVFAEHIELWHIYTLSVIFGIAGAFFLPAMMSVIPRLVSKNRLQAANSLVVGTSQLAGLLGPATAGVVVGALGSAAALGIDAGTFAFASVALLLMSGTADRNGAVAPSAGSGPRPGALADLKDGLRYAWSEPAIRAIIPAIAIINFCFIGPIDVGLATMAHDTFSGGATDYGIMLSAFGGSAVLGAVIAGSRRFRHRGLMTVILSGVMGVGLGLLGITQNVVQAAGLLAVMGVASSFINIVMLAWLQMTIREDMLGRVMSLVMFASAGLAPVSLALAGWLSDVSPTAMFAGAGVLALLACLLMVTSRAIRAID